MAFKEHIGFSNFVSIGSMIDVDFGDLIDFLGNDYTVKSILLYIESITNFRKFMSASRSVSRVKPIIVLKAGRSSAGAKAASSHTGAMVGEDAVYDVAFKRAGIVRVDTIEELFDCAELMGKQPRPCGSRLAVITNGGGPGVMAADFLSHHGHEPARLTAEIEAELNAVLPACWSRNNPIDILGDATVDRFRQVLQICLNAREFDGILAIFAPQAMTEPLKVAQCLVETMKTKTYPIFTCWMGGGSAEAAVELLNGAGIPTFATPERAIRAFLYMVAYTVTHEMLMEVPPKLPKNMVFDKKKAEELLSWNRKKGPLPESDTWDLLDAYGLPMIKTIKAETEEQAAGLGLGIGYPLIMKVSSPEIIHKTDARGIYPGLHSEADIRRAYRKIVDAAARFKPGARISSVTLQPYLAEPDFEILLGAKRDPDFGPVILFGMGGIYTEVLKDLSLGLPPMNRLLARRMMEATKAYTLLKGYRNRPAADLEALEEIILRLSQLLVDFPEITELDMNPILIKDGRPVVVDARIFLSFINVPSSLHLVIGPYPEDSEYHMVTESDVRIFVRPVKPEDAPLFVDLFKILSPTTIYFRFFGALKELQPEMLARFTQIDYDREIALVAIDEDCQTERMLGVARVVGDPDAKEGEFAVLVADAWQGKGIGAALLRKLLLLAERKGFKYIHGIVLRENTKMLALGKKMGFTVKRGDDPGESELQIRFGDPDLIEDLESL
jgi:acetyltransferase